MTSIPRDKRGGFTLLELIIVVAISGVVMAIGSSTFVAVASAWNESKTVTELDAQADLALETIRRDITDALSAEVSGVAIRGASKTVSDSRTYPAAQHADDSLMIPIRALDPSRELSVPASVGYRVDRGAGATGVLVRTVGPLGTANPQTNRLEVMPGAVVQGFNVEYLVPGGNGLWVDEWTEPRMPAAVRISLAIEDTDRPNQFQSSRQIVIPVRVR